jgi:hypothetical protein
MSHPPQNQIRCPVCHQTDQTILVEDLYFALIENNKQILSRFDIPSAQKKSILRDIRPPDLEKLPIWQIISPDILSGTIILVIVLLIATTGGQPGFDQRFLFPIILLLGYLIFRRFLVTKFSEQKNKRQTEINQAQKAVNLWSSLFICLRDKTVFSGHDGVIFSISELQNKMINPQSL